MVVLGGGGCFLSVRYPCRPETPNRWWCAATQSCATLSLSLSCKITRCENEQATRRLCPKPYALTRWWCATLNPETNHLQRRHRGTSLIRNPDQVVVCGDAIVCAAACALKVLPPPSPKQTI